MLWNLFRRSNKAEWQGEYNNSPTRIVVRDKTIGGRRVMIYKDTQLRMFGYMADGYGDTGPKFQSELQAIEAAENRFE